MFRLFSLRKLLLLLLLSAMIFIIGGGFTALSAAVRKGPIKRVAVFAFAPPFMKAYEGLRAGLAGHGYKLDEEIIFDVHCLNQDISNVALLTEAAVAADYDLIFSVTTPVTQAVQAALISRGIDIPVVFTSVADPLGSKIVSDLRHPGGNFTGVSHLSIELLAQRLLLFKKAFPALRRVAVFYDPDEEISKRAFAQGYLLQAAGDAGIDLVVNQVRSHNEILNCCRNFTEGQADALFMLPDALSVAHFNELLELSHRFKIPLMVIDNMLLERGGVIGYSPDFYEVGFQAATMVEQIFKGILPGDIAVQNPEKVKLVVSLKEARLLGLELSDDILLQADEVIR